MTAPKTKSIMEKHGYSDPDLKNKNHDEAVIKLCTPTEAERIAREMAGLSSKWMAIGIKTTAEKPIMDGRWIVGFVDVKIYVDGWQCCESCFEKMGKAEELMNLSGFDDWDTDFHKNFLKLDPCHKLKDIYISGRNDFIIEVKTRPISAGELLRQLNTYREHVGGEIAVYFTRHACDYKEFLRGQDVHCFQPDNEDISGIDFS